VFSAFALAFEIFEHIIVGMFSGKSKISIVEPHVSEIGARHVLSREIGTRSQVAEEC
jgi:hypothetical protein